MGHILDELTHPTGADQPRGAQPQGSTPLGPAPVPAHTHPFLQPSGGDLATLIRLLQTRPDWLGPAQMTDNGLHAVAHQSAATVALAGDAASHNLLADAIDDSPSGAYNGATGIYTVKQAGHYLVATMVVAQLVAVVNNPQRLVASIGRNGAENRRLQDLTLRGMVAADFVPIGGSGVVWGCAVGDQLAIRLVNVGPTAVNLLGAYAPQTWLEVFFLGAT